MSVAAASAVPSALRRVAFIGLGNMGSRMAASLLRRGHALAAVSYTHLTLPTNREV